MAFSLCMYKVQGESYPVLKKEEELALFEKIKNGDSRAKESLIKANMRLVFILAYKVKQKQENADVEDLIQDGTIGLIHSIDRFDTERGTRFSTYAVYWILHYMKKALHDHSRNIRQPANIPQLFIAIEKYETEYFARYQKFPTIINIARELEVTEDCVARVKKTCIPTISLNLPLNEDSEFSIEDVLSDKCITRTEDEACKNIFRQEFEKALSKIKEPELSYIRMYYGVSNTPRATFKEIGKAFGVTGESVRRNMMCALKKAKKMKEFQPLLEHLE